MHLRYHGAALPAAVLLASLASTDCMADAYCYRWTDAHGVVHLSDQPQHIPTAARDSAARWRCRTIHTSAGTASTLGQPGAAAAGGGAPAPLPPTAQRSAHVAASHSSSHRFLTDVERRIHRHEAVTTTELATYNRIKQALVPQSAAPGAAGAP